jgi:hypothetical protein
MTNKFVKVDGVWVGLVLFGNARVMSVGLKQQS